MRAPQHYGEPVSLHVGSLALAIVVENFYGDDIGTFRDATESYKRDMKWTIRQRPHTIGWKRQFQHNESHVRSHLP